MSEENGTRIGNYVDNGHKTGQQLIAIHAEIALPKGWMKHAEVLKMIAHHLIIGVHKIRLAIGQINSFILLNGTHELC